MKNTVLRIKNNHSESEKSVIRRIDSDISNYAYHNCRDGKPKLENIDLFFASVPEDYKIIGIADNSLYRQLSEDDKKRYKQEYLITKLIYEAPAGVSADDFILTFAYVNNDYITSNDQFLDHSWPSREWINSHRITFMIIEGQLIFHFPDSSTYPQLVVQERSTLEVLKEIEDSEKDSEWDVYK